MFIAPERYHLFLENGLRRFSCNDFLPEKSLTKIVHVLFISDTILKTCQKRNMRNGQSCTGTNRIETGMSDKNGCRSPDTHLLKFTASNKENVIQKWNR
jgi:hypothetical protein